MKQILILLKVAIVLIAIAALAVCAIPLPDQLGHEVAKTPETAWVIYLFLADGYVIAALFFMGSYQAFRLLTNIGERQGVSERSARALKNIKRFAMATGGLIVAGVAVVMLFAHAKEDDPAGFVALGFLATLVSAAITIVSAVFQRRIEKAMDRKRRSETL